MKISKFLSENFQFLVVKCSIYIRIKVCFRDVHVDIIGVEIMFLPSYS